MGIGKTLVILGIICIAAGLFFMAGGKLSFLGHLPGDIHFSKDNKCLTDPHLLPP